MNRNDLAMPSPGSGVRKGLVSLSEDYSRSPMRSPRRTPMSPMKSPKKSPISRSSPMKSPRRTPLQKPKNGLLEEVSVHLSLPSFHNKKQSKMTWKCCACNYENCNTLSSECSICGMQRSLSNLSAAGANNSNNLDASSTWQDSASTLDCDSSVNSFGGDGSNSFEESSNSLSLHNSFSLHEDDLLFMDSEKIVGTSGSSSSSGKRPFAGHASLPAVVGNGNHNFHNSFSSIRSTRSTRSAFRGRRQRAAAAVVEPDDDFHNHNNSVMSFCDWNPNEKLQSWSCQHCTFVNENPLHLACEMCGQRRLNNRHQAETEEEKNDNDDDDEEELRLIQEEQMRELIQVQQDLMSGFGRSAAAAAPSAAVSPPPTGGARAASPLTTTATTGRFDTRDLQREISHVVPSTPRSAAANRHRRPSPLSFLELSDDEDDNGQGDDHARLEDLLATTKSLLMDFKRQRTTFDDDDDKNLAAATAAAAKLDTKPAAVVVSPSMIGAAAHYKSSSSSSANESIAGCNARNETPKSVTNCLKYSMKATGGKLHYDDLCLPLLWGDDMDDLKKNKKGGKQVAAAATKTEES